MIQSIITVVYILIAIITAYWVALDFEKKGLGARKNAVWIGLTGLFWIIVVIIMIEERVFNDGEEEA